MDIKTLRQDREEDKKEFYEFTASVNKNFASIQRNFHKIQASLRKLTDSTCSDEDEEQEEPPSAQASNHATP